jgi:hypothetical protein
MGLFGQQNVNTYWTEQYKTEQQRRTKGYFGILDNLCRGQKVVQFSGGTRISVFVRSLDSQFV